VLKLINPLSQIVENFENTLDHLPCIFNVNRALVQLFHWM